jgi:hypothetical protein
MPAEPNYDNVTRVEIIGPGGLVFSYYCEPGVAPDVQDDGRTLKVFVGEEVDWRTTMQRSRTARPEAAEVCPHDREPDNCCQGYDSDCEGPRRAARPAEAWSDLCAGCKGYENEPDCGTCWGCLLEVGTEEDCS